MVAPLVAASLIGAGGSILGGLIGNRNNRSTVADQATLQREFAQHGIRWKVADAKAAGLHPLYAIGAQGASYSPTTITDSMGPAVAEAAQQIGSGIHAEANRRTRARELHQQRQLQREEIILGQQRLRSQIHVDTAQANYYNAMAAQALRQPSSGFGGSSPRGSLGVVDAESPEGQAAVQAAEDLVGS